MSSSPHRRLTPVILDFLDPRLLFSFFSGRHSSSSFSDSDGDTSSSSSMVGSCRGARAVDVLALGFEKKKKSVRGW